MSLVTDPEILKGGSEDDVSATSRLLQTHTTKYMPFIQKKMAYCKKSEPKGVPPQLPPLNPPPDELTRKDFTV